MRMVESQARVLREREISGSCSVVVAGHDGSGLERVWRERWRPATAERGEVEEPGRRWTRDEDERQVVDETEGPNHLETGADKDSDSDSGSDLRRSA
jgi:hypothetical protein